MCCRVDRCCFCFDHVLGVRVLACLLILVEVSIIVLGTLFLPQFLFAIAPTSSIGIICDILMLVATIRTSRWLLLPWLIYGMILVVGLALAAVLRVAIPLGSKGGTTEQEWLERDWLTVAASSLAFLAAAGLLLYFWIVVLELFIRMAPVQDYDGVIYGQAPFQAGPYVGGGGMMPMQQQQQLYGQYGGYVYQQGTLRAPPPPHMMMRYGE